LIRKDVSKICEFLSKKVEIMSTKARDGRLAVLLLLTFALFIFDMNCRNYGLFSEIRTDRRPCQQLIFNFPDKLLVKNCTFSDTPSKDGSMPAEFSPLFFAPMPINRANKDMLMTVTGIGPALADDIVAYRRLVGPFKSSKDLLNIRGIGAKRAIKFARVFTFAEAP